MPNLKPESLSWLDNLAALEVQLEKTPLATHAELGKAIHLDRSMVTILSAIKICFDPAAIEKVRLAAKGDSPYLFSYNKAKALSGLGKAKRVASPDEFHTALDIALSRRLLPKEIEALVDWIISGKPAEAFDPSASPRKGLAQSKRGTQLVASSQMNANPPQTVEETTEPEEEVDENTQPTKPKRQKNETLGQKIGSGIDQFLGQAGGETHQPRSTKTSGRRPAKSSQVALKVAEKFGKWFAKIAWKELFKIEHQICRKLAHAIVPLHTHSTGSGRAHSSRRHKSGSLRQGFITLFLTPLHWAVYVLLQYAFLLMVTTVLVCPFVPWLKPFLEWPFRLAAHFAVYDFPAWVWACAQSHLGPTLVIGALLAIGLYFAWKAEPLRISLLSAGLAYLIVQGRGWSYLPVSLSQTSSAENQPVSITTSSQTVMSSKLGSSGLKTSNSKLRTSNSTPIASYQPSISFQSAVSPSDSSPVQTLYDPKLLEQEIAALPQNCIVKSFPVLTDETMPGDLAVSRMQGVTDADKYTMMLGSGKQKIQSITTTTTNLIINYKSTDPFNMFNGPGQLNFFWEDVLYIHTDAIYSGASVLPNHVARLVASQQVAPEMTPQMYQLSLVVSGSKYALTIQCASADDLKHLVSTMEYFIRNSRLGHDTALAGMPYLHQGLVLNNDRVVDKLWANSPAANAVSDIETAQPTRVAQLGASQQVKAGVALGDHLWSVGTITSEQQSRNDLEAGLSTLPVTLFAVSDSDWTKAMIAARQSGSNNAIHPKLRKVVLNSI